MCARCPTRGIDTPGQVAPKSVSEYTGTVLIHVGLLAYILCMCCPTSLQANGFYGARGIAGHVPSMYIYFANKFLKNIDRSHRQEHVQYLEYSKPGWTFHGKGVHCSEV